MHTHGGAVKSRTDCNGAVWDVIRKQMADLQAENARLKGEVKDLRAAVASLRVVPVPSDRNCRLVLIQDSA